jgi:hypothetical protein
LCRTAAASIVMVRLGGHQHQLSRSRNGHPYQDVEDYHDSINWLEALPCTRKHSEMSGLAGNDAYSSSLSAEAITVALQQTWICNQESAALDSFITCNRQGMPSKKVLDGSSGRSSNAGCCNHQTGGGTSLESSMNRISAAEFTEQDFEQALQDMTTFDSDWSHLAAACDSTPSTLVPESHRGSSQQQLWALPATHEHAAVRRPAGGLLPTAMHTSAGAGELIRSTSPAAQRVAASCDDETLQLSDRRQGARHHLAAAAAPTAVAAAGGVLQVVHSDTQISPDSLWPGGFSLSSSSAWLPASGTGDADRNAAPAAPGHQLQAAMSELARATASRTNSLDDAVVHAMLDLMPPTQAQRHYQAVCKQQQQQQQPTATSKQVSACTLQRKYKQLMQHHQQQDVMQHHQQQQDVLLQSAGPIRQMTGHLFMGSTPPSLLGGAVQHNAPQMGLGSSSSSVKRGLAQSRTFSDRRIRHMRISVAAAAALCRAQSLQQQHRKQRQQRLLLLRHRLSQRRDGLRWLDQPPTG